MTTSIDTVRAPGSWSSFEPGLVFTSTAYDARESRRSTPKTIWFRAATARAVAQLPFQGSRSLGDEDNECDGRHKRAAEHEQQTSTAHVSIVAPRPLPSVGGLFRSLSISAVLENRYCHTCCARTPNRCVTAQ
jgi:hypothetical protein